MKYAHVIQGTFVERPNRFIAMVNIHGHIEKAHVKNTGRCRELLIPGTTVFLQVHDDPKRKTKYSLITVLKGDTYINIDSQIPNKLAEEYVKAGHVLNEPLTVKREKTYGDSRFDLFVTSGNRQMFIEVKGVTLNQEGVARFPDAPTERGVKHIKGLIKAIENGYEAAILFIVQMKGISHFEPNMETHPEFGHVLKEAQKAGVRLLAVDCQVGSDWIETDQPVEINLDSVD